MRIKEFAARTGLSPDTIRFYETKGLLKPARNANSRYRDFGSEDLAIVDDILTSQALGFSLKEMQEGLELWRTGSLDQSAKLQAIRQRLAEVRRRRAEYESIERYLQAKAGWVETGEVGSGPLFDSRLALCRESGRG